MEQTQIGLEETFNQDHCMKLVKDYFKQSTGLEKFLTKIKYPHKFAYTLLGHMAMLKAPEAETIVAIMSNHVETVEELTELLEGAVGIGLVQYEMGVFKIALQLPREIQAQVNLFMSPLPMLVEPKELIRNTDSGYLTVENDSVILNEHNPIKDDVNLDHLNKMNKVKLSLNMNVVYGATNIWKNAKTADAMKQLKHFNQVSKFVYEVMVNEGNEFYLTHKYDARGRCYAKAYNINYQGNDYCKAIVEFTNKELIK